LSLFLSPTVTAAATATAAVTTSAVTAVATALATTTADSNDRKKIHLATILTEAKVMKELFAF